MNKIKLAVISHLYPTDLFPTKGKFIQDQFTLLNASDKVEPSLFVPTPYSIPFTKRWEKNNTELIEPSVKKKRVSYLSFPQKRYPSLIRNSISKNILTSLHKQPIDLVHIHWLYPDGLVIPQLKKEGYKTILTIHGSDWYQNLSNPTLFNLLKESLLATDRILYSGPKLKGDIENIFPEINEKSDVIYNTVDTALYKPVAKISQKSLKEKLNWDTSKIHSLTVANIRHEKGIDLLIEAINNNESLKNIAFHIVEELDSSDYSKKVSELIRKNPFKNIHLHPFVPPLDLIEFYQSSDFYILPSRREGFNVSILEAAACGVPIVCSDVGGNRELIELGTGFISNPNHPSSFAKTLEKMSVSYENFDSQKLHNAVEQKVGSISFQNNLLSQYTSLLQ